MPRPRQRHPRGHMLSALLAIVYGVRPPSVNGSMQCVGTRALDRACLLQDLYYDTQERTFTYYGKTIANDTQKGGTLEADTDTFDSATQFLSVAKENGDFAVEWSSGTPPDHSDASDTCVVELPILLRQESPLGTYSYGHMLRDNYYHLIQIPKAFDLNIASFAWVTWPRERGNNAFTAMPVLAKINSLLSPHRTRRWFELESDCGEKGNTVGPDVASEAPRYIRIERALVTGASDRHWTDVPGACKAAEFAQMRSHAWGRHGILPRATPRKADPIRMSVLLKPEADKRRLFVPQNVLDAARKKYPQLDIRLHTGSEEEEGAQLNWLSRTDILVTNIGSASFRMLYLPDGAQVILAGPLEIPHKDESGRVTRVKHLFREEASCWDFVPNFTVHRYHVTDVADIDFKPLQASRATENAGADAMNRLRDADVTLRPKQFLRLLEKAVQGVLAGRS